MIEKEIVDEELFAGTKGGVNKRNRDDGGSRSNCKYDRSLQAGESGFVARIHWATGGKVFSAARTGGSAAGWWGGSIGYNDPRWRLRRVSVGLLVASLMLGCSLSSFADPPRDRCERINLRGSEEPWWITSVTLWEDEQAGGRGAKESAPVLLFTDSQTQRLVSVDQTGVFKNKSSNFRNQIPAFYPEVVKAHKGTLLFQLPQGHLVQTTGFGMPLSGSELIWGPGAGAEILTVDDIERAKEERLASAKAEGRVLVEALWQWDVIEDSRTSRLLIVGFGDLYDGSQGEWVFGMAQFPWDAPEEARIIPGFPKIPTSDRAGVVRTLFRFRYSLLAVVGNHVFALLPGSPSKLLRYSINEPESGFLPVEDVNVGSAPLIPDLNSLKAEYKQLMDALSRSAYTVAIQAVGDDLILVSREPAGSDTRWSLQMMVLEERGVLKKHPSVVVNGLTRPHLWFTSSSSNLYIVEQGPAVELWAQQPTESLLIVPKRLLGAEGTSAYVCSQ